MLRITVSIVLMLQCFTHGLGRHGMYQRPSTDAMSSEMPNGYTENINNDDWSIPDSKFFFNYEQMRKDQPTQVEQREEDLGQYMYTNPSTSTSSTTTTTTTTPEPNVEPLNNEDKIPEAEAVFNNPIVVLASPHHHRHSHHRHHHHKHPDVSVHPIPNLPEKQEVDIDERPHFPAHSWNEMNYPSAYPINMPPPPALPRWEDLNELIKHQLQHQHYAKPYSSSHKEHVSTSTNMPIKVTTRHSHQSHHQKKRKDTPTTALPVLSEMKSAPSLGHKRNKAQHSNRGSHKFSWNDVPQTPTVLPSSTTKASVLSQRGPPPPVPTLSPWYDGFGK